LIDCEKNEIARGRSLAALAPKQIFKALFASPRRRKKRRRREEMAEKNETGPKNTDRRQDQKPIATEPMHARIIPLFPDFEISSSGTRAGVKSSGSLKRWTLRLI
jgi:hypothetical protein